MKQYRAVENGVVLFATVILFASPSPSHAQTNSWLNPASGYWEDASWSLGQLPGPRQTILLTNAGWKALEIRHPTAVNFSQTLTADSIIISSPTNSLNTLLLNFVGVDSPLTVNSLTLNENSVVTMRSSALLVQSNLSIGGTFNQNDFSGVTSSILQIGDVGPGTYVLSNGTLTTPVMEVLGGWNHPAHFDQEGGYHLAHQLWMNPGGEYDLHGGQLGGELLMKGGSLIQSGGDLVLPAFSLDGSYSLSAGTLEVTNGLTVYQGSITQSGGTNTSSWFSLGSSDPDLPSQMGTYTMSNGLMNLSSEGLIYYHGTLVQEGGAINIHGPLNMPYYYVGPYRGDYLAGAFHMNGGTFSAESVNSSGWIEQHGGAIQIAGDFTLFFYPAGYSLTGGELNTSNTLVGPAGITFTQSGGVHHVQHLLRIATPPGYPYGYTMTGGQLIAPDIDLAANCSFTHNGGTISNSDALILEGGIWTENTPEAHLGCLHLTGGASSLLLTNGPCVIHFLASSSEVWSNNATLQINNWAGSANGNGPSQIFFGNDSYGLTSAQLSQIQFVFSDGTYPARILSSGEIVPLNPTNQATATLVPQLGGAMQLILSGPLNRTFEIDISTDLVNWTPWQTQFNTSGTLSITDNMATNYAARYYRTILLP